VIVSRGRSTIFLTWFLKNSNLVLDQRSYDSLKHRDKNIDSALLRKFKNCYLHLKAVNFWKNLRGPIYSCCFTYAPISNSYMISE